MSTCVNCLVFSVPTLYLLSITWQTAKLLVSQTTIINFDPNQRTLSTLSNSVYIFLRHPWGRFIHVYDLFGWSPHTGQSASAHHVNGSSLSLWWVNLSDCIQSAKHPDRCVLQSWQFPLYLLTKVMVGTELQFVRFIRGVDWGTLSRCCWWRRENFVEIGDG